MKKLAVIILVFSMLCSCGSNYAAKAGDYKISEGEIKYYLSNIKSQMSGTELVSDEDWQTLEIEGKKAIDVAKDRALELVADTVAYVEIADYLDVELTDSEEDRVDAVKQNLITQYGGQSGYNKFLKTQEINDDFVELLCESMMYSEKLSELAVSENPITDAERDAMYETIISGTKYKAKHILFATVDTTTRQPLSDEVKAQKKALAESTYKRVLAGEDYDKLMKELSEDPGLATNPDGYVFGTGEMVPEFESCTASLGMNEVGLVESSLGFHIIKRLPIEKADVEDEIETALKQTKLQEAMTVWKEKAGFKVVKNDAVFDSIS